MAKELQDPSMDIRQRVFPTEEPLTVSVLKADGTTIAEEVVTGPKVWVTLKGQVADPAAANDVDRKPKRVSGSFVIEDPSAVTQQQVFQAAKNILKSKWGF